MAFALGALILLGAAPSSKPHRIGPLARLAAGDPPLVLSSQAQGAGFPTPVFAPQPLIAEGDDGSKVAVGDFDEDGLPDMAVSIHQENRVQVFLGTGGGAFAAPTSHTVGALPNYIVTGDFDRDGHLDLATANRGPSTVSVLMGDGTGGYAPAVAYSAGAGAYSIALADLDGDGDLDLAVPDNGTNTISLLLGTGTGTFALPADITVGSNPSSIAVGDFNRDGRLDLAVANMGSDNVSVLAGDPAGGFTPGPTVAAGHQPGTIATADFDGDGFLDLVTSNFGSNSASVLRGDGALGFTAAGTLAASIPFAVAAADANGDGRPDVLVVNSGPSTVSVYVGDGTGGFEAPRTFPAGTTPREVTVADLDGDGHPDLAVPSVGTNVLAVLLARPPTVTVTAGSPMTDTATLTGGASPTGTITFRAYGPGAGCTAPAFTSVRTVHGPGAYTSAAFTPLAVGTYHWIASYSGDSNHPALAGPCADAFEAVTVTQAAPSVSTQARGAGPVGLAFGAPVTSPAGDAANDVVAGDFDEDGNPDVAIANFNAGTVTVFLGDGVGGLVSRSDQTVGAIPASIATGDFNRDRNLDLVTANQGTMAVAQSFSVPGSLSVLLGNGTGGFSPAANYLAGRGPFGVVVADLNHDGNQDLVAAASHSDEVAVLLGDGTGRFGPATTYAVGDGPTEVTVGDFDEDGDLDVAASNSLADTVSILLGNGSGGLSAGATVGIGGAGFDQPYSLTAGDFDADGHLDLATANASGGTASVLTGNGAGGFVQTATLTPGVTPVSVAATDLNRDGTADLVVGNRNSDTVAVFAGMAGGGFAPAATSAAGSGPGGLALADLDGDGHLDLAVADVNGDSVTVLRAQATPVTSTAGAPSTDTATIAGGANPTGTITFRAYGPNDASCSSAVFSSTQPVTGNGTYASAPFTATSAGTYRWVATYSGDAANASRAGTCADGFEALTVTKATPTLTTQASPSAPAGATITDTATLAGGASPTGSVVFQLYGPTDPTCAGTPATTSTKPVVGNGNVASDGYVTPAVGTWRWAAAYSGDANNSAVAGSCNDANESVTVTKATPTLSTQASASVRAGAAITDTATLTGGAGPTGSVTFRLFGPGGATCTASPLSTSTKPVTGNGGVTSDPVTTTAAGTWRWTAAYSGDANNNAVSGLCDDPNESVIVAKASPTLTLRSSGSAPATTPVGGAISAVATLAGGVGPTGSLTIRAYGPDDASCARSPASEATVGVSGNGDYPAPAFTATSLGTYRFVAAYSGDEANNPVATPCGDGVAVVKASPTLSTRASPPIPDRGAVSDTATLARGFQPTGTITFRVFGPTDATCSAAPFFTATAQVNGDGDYRSGTVPAPQLGTYRFIASYGGDAGNNAVSGACNDPNESVLVGPLPSTTLPPTTATSTSTSTTVGGSSTTTSTTRGLPPTLPPQDDQGSSDDTPLPPDDTTVPTTVPTGTTVPATIPGSTTVPTGTTLPAASTTTPTATTSPPTTPPAPTTSPPTTTPAAPTPTGTTPAAAGAAGGTQGSSTGPITTLGQGTSTTTTAGGPAGTATSTGPAPAPTAPVPGGPLVAQGAAPEPGPIASQAIGLVALTLDGVPTGPPGAGLKVSGSGFAACDTVYVFFDGTRIGTTSPASSGRVSASLEVPGEAHPGPHQVTASCRASGSPAVVSTAFEVTAADVHRVAIISSLPTPDQVDFRPGALLVSGVVASASMLLIAFPGELFNTTLEEHYNEVRRWFRLGPKRRRRRGRSQIVPFLAFLAAGGLLYSLLNPAFRFDRSSLAATVGLSLSMGIVTLAFDVPGLIYMRRYEGEWGRLVILPGTLGVAAACVVLSRAVHFLPGYFYGLISGMSYRKEMSASVRGRLAAVSTGFVLGLSIVSWLAMLPVSHIADHPHPSLVVLVLEATLGGIFWCGLDSLVIGLLPLRFLQGSDLKRWSRAGWLLLLILTQVAFVHILLRPGTGYVADARQSPTTIVIGLFLVFALLSFGFWAYFRVHDAAEEEDKDEPAEVI